MTQVSRDDVQHLAQLSSLYLDDSDIDGLKTDIENILDYVEQLNELNTDTVEPTYQVTDLENVWREDVVMTEDVTRDQLLDLTQEATDHQVKVPKVL